MPQVKNVGAVMVCANCRLSKPLSEYGPSTRDPSMPKKICFDCEGSGGQRSFEAAAARASGRQPGQAPRLEPVDSTEGAAQAILGAMPQMLATLTARAKAGDTRSYDRLIELAGGEGVVRDLLAGRSGESEGPAEREPSIFELMAMKPGQLTDSA